MTSAFNDRSHATSWVTRCALALACALGCAVVGCSGDDVAVAAMADPPGTMRGELKLYSATLEDGTSELHYALLGATGEERPLLFRSTPSVAPGTIIRVSGETSAPVIDVTSWEIVPSATSEIASQSEALVGGTPEPSRKMCVIMIELNGATFPASLSKDVIDQSFFTGSKSVDAFYRENSYGKTGLDGQVFGPFPYTMAACATTDTRAMATAMRARIAPEVCDQYAYVFTRSTICAWGGLGAVGTPAAPQKDTWYNGSVSCVVAVQEPGHNYGMAHSSSLACGPTTAPTTFAADVATCRHNEYGDRFDPMGGACRHMNVWQKQYERWFGGCNTVKVPGSGTFNLLPTELPCDGVQALDIPLPTPKVFSRPAGGGSSAGSDTLTDYYLEYRVSAGFDTGLAPMVLLHVGTPSPSQTATGRAAGGKHTWLLDMHPVGTAGFADAGFKAGETFTDPGGDLTITVVSMDADKAVVRIDRPGGVGDPVCVLPGIPASDNMPFVGPGAASCGTAPPPPPDDAGVASPPVVRRDAAVDIPIARPDGGTTPMTRDAGITSPPPARVDAAPAPEASAPAMNNDPPAAPRIDAAAPPIEGGSFVPIAPVAEHVDGVEGGCSCRTAPGSGSGRSAGEAAVGLALAIGAARRIRRRRAA